MKYIAVINIDAGTMRTGRVSSKTVEIILKEWDIPTEIHIVKGKNILKKIKRFKEIKDTTFIAAGGDGTVHALINAIDLRYNSIAILPLGTFNHCARDLGIPLDLSSAAQVIKKDNRHEIDLGQVNSHYFVNNASIGLYPEIVKERIKHMKSGYSKMRAMIKASISKFIQFPEKRLTLKYDDNKIKKKFSFIFIGNNVYRTDLLHYGSREKLNSNILSLFYPSTASRLKMYKFLLLPFIKPGEKSKDIVSTKVTSLMVKGSYRLLMVGVDGEIRNMAPPLKFHSTPSICTVISPGKDEGKV